MEETQIIEKEAQDSFFESDDDAAFLNNILSKKPAEKLVDVPEWNTKILCKALNAADRMKIQLAAFDEKNKTTDWRNTFHLVMMCGCYNPKTERRIFNEKHKDILMRQQDGATIELLAFTILRLSRMVAADSDNAKKK
jgi:hypothetical protein